MGEMIRKFFAGITKETNEQEITSTDLASTIDVDRDGEVLLPDGCVLDNFRKNPVVLWAHGRETSLPIGKALWIKATEAGLLAKTKYADTAFARDVWKLKQGGFIRGLSVGFIPIEMTTKRDEIAALQLKYKWQGAADRVITKWELLEYSDCPVGCNPNALTLMMKSVTSKEMKDLLDELVVCAGCKQPFDYAAQPEVSMGAVKCPNCGASVNQEGELLTEKDGRDPLPVKLARDLSPVVKLICPHCDQEIAEKSITAREGNPDLTYHGPCVDKGPIKMPTQEELKEASLKVGAVLNRKNKENLTKAQELIQTVLDSAGDEEEDPGKSKETKEPDPIVLPPDAISDERAIYLFGTIDTAVAQTVCQRLVEMDKVDSQAPIRLVIGSYGGEVYPAFSMIDTIAALKAPVETVGLGMIMSAGLLIFMTGKNRKISQNAAILSHRFWTSCAGTQAELMAERVELDRLHQRILDLYKKHTNLKSDEEVQSVLLKETDVWVTAQDAVRYGIADAILQTGDLTETKAATEFVKAATQRWIKDMSLAEGERIQAKEKTEQEAKEKADQEAKDRQVREQKDETARMIKEFAENVNKRLDRLTGKVS